MCVCLVSFNKGDEASVPVTIGRKLLNWIRLSAGKLTAMLKNTKLSQQDLSNPQLPNFF